MQCENCGKEIIKELNVYRDETVGYSAMIRDNRIVIFTDSEEIVHGEPEEICCPHCDKEVHLNLEVEWE